MTNLPNTIKRKDDVQQAQIDHEVFVEERTTLPNTSYKITDIVTGEIRNVLSANHYEYNSGLPLAPAVDMPRLSLRERVERLTQSGYDLSSYYHHVPLSDPDDWSEDDDPDSLTAAEQGYVDHIDFVEELNASKVQKASEDAQATPPADGPDAPKSGDGKAGSEAVPPPKSPEKA